MMMRGFSDDDVKTLIADTLRLFVGNGRRVTFPDLAAATSDNERKLRSYVEQDGPMMPLDVFFRVFAVLPPAAFARVARHVGFSAAPLDHDEAATVRKVMAQASRLVADGSEFLEDNVITPTERAVLARGASELLPQLAALAGAPISI
jgi:hypothetical protein